MDLTQDASGDSDTWCLHIIKIVVTHGWRIHGAMLQNKCPMLCNMVSCLFTCMWNTRKEIAEHQGGNEKLMMQIAVLRKEKGLAGCHLRANKGYIALLAANDTENLNEIDNLKANLEVLKDTLDSHEIAYELIPRKTCKEST